MKYIMNIWLSDNKSWIPFLLALTIIICVNIIFCAILNMKNIEYWVRIYALEGLIANTFAAILFIGSDWKPFRTHIIPTEKIQGLKAGRDLLFSRSYLVEGDEGFGDIINELNIQEATEFDTKGLKVTSKDLTKQSSGTTLYFGTEKIFALPEQGDESDKKTNIPKSIGTDTLVDGRIDQAILRLERSGKQQTLEMGIRLFLLGFLLQIISYVLPLINVIRICGTI